MDDERLIQRRESARIRQQLGRQSISSEKRAQILSQNAAPHMQAREHRSKAQQARQHQSQAQRQQVLAQEAEFQHSKCFVHRCY